MKDSALYQSVSHFEIDETPAALSFAKRLARENGWTESFAERVVSEYKRFVYLAMVAGHPVTPSDEVDQAWHLHMLYTHSYFDRLCKKVLGRQLAHGPTKGGKSEDAKFEDWYERTKKSYREEFGTEPPAEIWPPAEIRFGNAPFFVRVNTKENFVVPRSAVRLAAGLCLTAAALVGVAGCAASLAQSTPLKNETIAILVVLGVVALVGLLVFLVKRYGGRGGNGCGSGCGSPGSGDSGCGGGGCGGGGCGGGGCGGGCGT